MNEIDAIEAKIKTYQVLKERAEHIKTVSDIKAVDPKTLIFSLADVVSKMIDINILRAEEAKAMVKELEKLAIRG